MIERRNGLESFEKGARSLSRPDIEILIGGFLSAHEESQLRTVLRMLPASL